MTTEIYDIEELINILQSKQLGVVAIHGAPSAGKTTLATILGKRLGGSVIIVDQYIKKNPSGRYPDFLDYQRLGIALDNVTSPTIIEGVCLLEVLDRILLKPDITIYARNPNDHDWVNYDINDIEYESQLSEIESNIQIARRCYPDSYHDDECLEKDNAIYHNKYKPVELSDFLYIRNR
ncbi:MAG: hypothetical protein HZA22_02965 [Nitrospirae bacterium]|nr:hypothetical protein [Nitrospirota bacterium]